MISTIGGVAVYSHRPADTGSVAAIEDTKVPLAAGTLEEEEDATPTDIADAEVPLAPAPAGDTEAAPAAGTTGAAPAATAGDAAALAADLADLTTVMDMMLAAPTTPVVTTTTITAPTGGTTEDTTTESNPADDEAARRAAAAAEAARQEAAAKAARVAEIQEKLML